MRVNQVLIHLIVNAIKFSKPNSTIQINVAAKNQPHGNSEFITIAVKDTGLGISI
jgi:signal transduction histidine kinase